MEDETCGFALFKWLDNFFQKYWLLEMFVRLILIYPIGYQFHKKSPTKTSPSCFINYIGTAHPTWKWGIQKWWVDKPLGNITYIQETRTHIFSIVESRWFIWFLHLQAPILHQTKISAWRNCSLENVWILRSKFMMNCEKKEANHFKAWTTDYQSNTQITKLSPL